MVMGGRWRGLDGWRGAGAQYWAHDHAYQHQQPEGDHEKVVRAKIKSVGGKQIIGG